MHSPDGPYDLEEFDTLVFRVRGDGRKYIASLRCENWLVDEASMDVWQAFLFARCRGVRGWVGGRRRRAPVEQRSRWGARAAAFPRREGEWSEVEVPLTRFLLTWRGRVVEEAVEVNPRAVTTLGISLAGGEELQARRASAVGVAAAAAAARAPPSSLALCHPPPAHTP